MKHLFSMILFSAVWLMSNPVKAQQSGSGLTSVKGRRLRQTLARENNFSWMFIFSDPEK